MWLSVRLMFCVCVDLWVGCCVSCMFERVLCLVKTYRTTIRINVCSVSTAVSYHSSKLNRKVCTVKSPIYGFVSSSSKVTARGTACFTSRPAVTLAASPQVSVSVQELHWLTHLLSSRLIFDLDSEWGCRWWFCAVLLTVYPSMHCARAGCVLVLLQGHFTQRWV